jgi:hypothetical protein
VSNAIEAIASPTVAPRRAVCGIRFMVLSCFCGWCRVMQESVVEDFSVVEERPAEPDAYRDPCCVSIRGACGGATRRPEGVSP